MPPLRIGALAWILCAGGCQLVYSWEGYSEPVAATACPLAATRCDDACVDLLRDSSHCGDCATSCGASQICASGHCSNPYYIDPSGDDANPGTEAQPWKKFEHAVPLLRPGDALVLKDGVYDTESTGYAHANCDASVEPHDFSGTKEDPIVLIAQNERRAYLKGDGNTFPVSIRKCAYWIVDGLRASGVAAGTGWQSSVFDLVEDSHLVARRLLGSRPSGDSAVISLWNTDDTLLEESEVYDFANSHGIAVSTCTRLTLRRNYVHPRLSAGTGEAEEGIAFSAVQDCLAENNVVEDTPYGFTVKGYFEGMGDGELGDDNRFYGNAVVGLDHTTSNGFYVQSLCGGLDPCPRDRDVARPEFVDSVIVGGNYGFRLRGQLDAHIAQATVIGTKLAGVSFVRTGDNATLASSAYLENALISPTSGIGCESVDQADWLFDFTHVWGPVDADYAPDDGHVNRIPDMDPKLGECMVRLPDASPIIGAGKNGKNVAGEIVYRYVNGELTKTPLWDPTLDYRFSGCGAVVEGVNSDPATSCIGVAARLHVGPSAMCSMPY